MAYKRNYKYQKDIFGGKHRKYFMDDLSGVSAYDMNTFRVLKKKLERDYVSFFSALNKLYERGEFKELSKNSVQLTNRTVSIIDSIIDSGVINKADIDIIVQHVSMLNDSRDLLVQKAEDIKALREKLGNIEETTGVRPEDLNISEKIVRSGARREAKKGREGALPFLKRTMPKTHGLAGELLSGAGAALLGPLAPLAKVAGGLGGELFGLGKGLLNKVGERKERKLASRLAPMSSQLDAGTLGGIGSARESGFGFGGAAKIERKKESVNALYEFYNKDAYKAKWTKELLTRTKATGKGGLGGLSSKFLALGSALLPLLGTAGAIAGTVGAFIFAKDKISELAGKIGEYFAVKANADKEIKRQETKQATIREGIAGTMMQAAKSGDESKRSRAFEQLQAAEVEKVQGQSGWFDSLFMKKWGVKTPKGKASVNIAAPPSTSSENLTVKEQREMLRTSPGNTTNSPKELSMGVSKLNSTLDQLIKITKDSNRRSAFDIKQPGLGNPNDSADPFVNSFATGALGGND
jgi:hypothetical protein